MTDNTSYPAGWYADTNEPGTERYFDGTAWTAQTRPQVAAVTPVSAEATGQPATKEPWFKRKGIVIPVGVVAGLIVIGGIGSALGGGSDDESVAAPAATSDSVVEEAASVDVVVPDTIGMTAKEAQALVENAGLEAEFSAADGVVLDRDNWTVLSTTPAAGATAKTGDKIVVSVEKKAKAQAAPAPAKPQTPTMTVAQENAVKSATSYLDYSDFSRAGLFQQLTSEYGEGFVPEDAEFAIAYLEGAGLVDWNAEAVGSAKAYLDYSSFSRNGLYDQLTSEYGEQFTPDQANYALAAVGL